jgi:hypothetical protein
MIGVHFRRLEFLGLASCNISNENTIIKLSQIPTLNRILFAENPICNEQQKLHEIQKHFDATKIGDNKCRLIPFWL